MQISQIKIADIADVDLSRIGVTKFGDFTVEVIDPVSDYLELMEVCFCFCFVLFFKWQLMQTRHQCLMGFSAGCI